LNSLLDGAVAILETAEPRAKVDLSHDLAERWRDGVLPIASARRPPDRPARPDRPRLCAPKDMPRRKAGGNMAKRVALLHALAHIELNAVDLAWDLIARFGDDHLPRTFFDDWVKVADEEALHFTLLSRRLTTLGAAYGDLPAHDGLWQSAIETAHDLLARLAVVPLVLEARGLDVTPAIIAQMERVGDTETAAILSIIYRDEVGHVATGMRWFDYFARVAGREPKQAWQDLVRRHFKGTLKPPFNRDARDRANMPVGFYEDV
jgi:uncharacterized ferritin-like protein (DUF455 family)